MKKIINLLLISFIAACLTACWSEDIPEAGAARHQVTDLTATPGDEEVLLSWSLPEGWNPTDFIVYYTDADSETVTLRTGGEMNCTVGGLVNDTQYTFYVQAVYGNSSRTTSPPSADPPRRGSRSPTSRSMRATRS